MRKMFTSEIYGCTGTVLREYCTFLMFVNIGYVHNLPNPNEIMKISDFNEDQKPSYLS